MIHKTFNEIYEERKNKPTHAQAFIAEVAEVTKRSVFTVKMWLTGRQHPDELANSVIAKHFGVDPDGLFPDKPVKSELQRKNEKSSLKGNLECEKNEVLNEK